MQKATEDKLKLYVLVRRDLPKSYRMVQGMHAAALYAAKTHPYGSDYNDKAWRADTGTIVALLVNDEEHLTHIQKYMSTTIGIPVASWWEPDLDNELTAVAFLDRDRDETLVNALRLA